MIQGKKDSLHPIFRGPHAPSPGTRLSLPRSATPGVPAAALAFAASASSSSAACGGYCSAHSARSYQDQFIELEKTLSGNGVHPASAPLHAAFSAPCARPCANASARSSALVHRQPEAVRGGVTRPSRCPNSEVIHLSPEAPCQKRICASKHQWSPKALCQNGLLPQQTKAQTKCRPSNQALQDDPMKRVLRLYYNDFGATGAPNGRPQLLSRGQNSKSVDNFRFRKRRRLKATTVSIFREPWHPKARTDSHFVSPDVHKSLSPALCFARTHAFKSDVSFASHEPRNPKATTVSHFVIPDRRRPPNCESPL